jgi:hypothetical protein
MVPFFSWSVALEGFLWQIILVEDGNLFIISVFMHHLLIYSAAYRLWFSFV